MFSGRYKKRRRGLLAVLLIVGGLLAGLAAAPRADGAVAGDHAQDGKRLSHNLDRRTNDGEYRTGPICCPGCRTDVAGCCCAPTNQRPTVTKKVTLSTAKPRMVGGKHVLWGRSEVIESVELTGPEPETQAVDRDDRSEHALYARNLCPVCPSGVSVKSRNLYERYFSKRTFSYCCPRQTKPQGTVTVTITVNPTGTASPRPPPPPPAGRGGLISGQVWYDNNKDGKYSPGVDSVIANRWIIIRRADGQIIARVKTDAKGYYSAITSKVYKKQKMTIALLSAPQKAVARLVTSASGNAVKNIPVPPAKIQGRVFVDMNRNGVFDKGDFPIANVPVTIRFKGNNTIWKTVKANAQGLFGFESQIRYPYTLLMATAGKLTRSLRLDGNGNGELIVAQAPGLLRGVTFLDSNGNFKRDAGESIAPNRGLEIRFPNKGRVLATVVTDAKGAMRAYVFPYPRQKFEVYDRGDARKAKAQRAIGDKLTEFTTDASGNVLADIPIPTTPPPTPSPPAPPPPSNSRTPTRTGSLLPSPPAPPPPPSPEPSPAFLDGTAFFDANGNKEFNQEETPLSESTLVIKFEDGSILGQVPTDEMGMFRYTFDSVYPSTTFWIYDSDDQLLRTFTTDSGGSALEIPVPIPVSRTSTATARPPSPPVTTNAGFKTSTKKPVVPASTAADATQTNGMPSKSVGSLTTAASAESTQAGLRTRTATTQPAKTSSSSQTSSTSTATATETRTVPPGFQARIAGEVFFDLNGNGIQDAGEPAAASLLIAVKYALNGTVIIQGSTDSNGSFFEPGPVVPDEALVAVAPDGSKSKSFTTDSYGNGAFKLPLPPALVQGVIWHDLNSDGVRQPSEPPLSGTAIQLVLSSNTALVLGSFTTNSTGGFSGPAGKYPNQEIHLVGFGGSPIYRTFSADARGNATVFVPIPPGKVSGTAYYDMNMDGQLDVNDVVASNVSISVSFASNTTATGSNRTDSQGAYLVKQIAYPGATIKVNGGSGRAIRNLTLDKSGSGQVDLPLPPAEIRGSAWFDGDKNGLQGPTEQPLNDTFVDITLVSTGAVLARVRTNATGGFVARIVPLPNAVLAIKSAQAAVLKTFSAGADGSAAVLVPIPLPKITGRIFWDFDGNSNFTAGIDRPAPFENLVILLPNGSVYANWVSAADGTMAFEPTVVLYNQPMSVARSSDPATILGRFSTDSLANGMFTIALPAAVIRGNAWYDLNKDKVQDANEPPVSNSAISIAWPNDTQLVRALTDAKGLFKVSSVPYPDTLFTVFTASGSRILTFTTDAQGNAVVPVPIPAPYIEGRVWFESTGILTGATYDAAVDLPMADQPLQLRFPNGSLFLDITTDQNGAILLLAAKAVAKTTLSLVDPRTPRTVMGTIELDEFGSGRIDLPIVPPTQYIYVTVFFDSNADAVYNSGDVPFQQKTLVLRAANGTDYMSGMVAGNGTMVVKVTQPLASASLSVYAADAPGQLLGTVKTNLFGGGSVVIPLPWPTVSGTLFWDMDFSKTQTAGDLALSTEPILILLANGVAWANLVTAADGSFSHRPAKPVPKGTFNIVRNSARTNILGTFATDVFGSASVKVPLEPAAIRVSAWYDLNLDGARGTRDEPGLANTPLDIVSSGGTTLATVQTNSSGYLTYSMVPMPGANLRIASQSGTVFKSFTTSPTGDASVLIPIPPPKVFGSVFWDMDLSGALTSADKGLAYEPLIAGLPDGTIWSNATTSSNGSFLFSSAVPAPNVALTIARASQPNVVIGTINTNAFTFGFKDIPLVPGRLTGQVWIDYNRNRILDAGEPVRGNSYMDFRWPSGALVIRVATDADGFFNETLPAYPNANITVYTASGSPVLWFFTDSSGNAVVPVPIPPPIVTGKMFLDGDGNGVWDPAFDVALPDQVLAFKFLNGSIFAAKITTDPKGEWLYLPSTTERFQNVTAYAISNPSVILGNFQLDQFGSGDFLIPITPPPPTITIRPIWFDMNEDGLPDSVPGQPADVPYGNQPVVLRFSNGTVYLTGTTFANGTVWFPVSNPVPGETLIITPASEPTRILGYITVNKFGSGEGSIPIPPPVITGTAFYDFNGDRIYTANVDSLATLRAFDVSVVSSGAAYAVAKTDSSAAFSFTPSVPMPNTALKFVVASTKAEAGNMTTNSVGGGSVVLILPPATVSGLVCLGSIVDGVCKGTPLNNSFVDLYRPDGSFFARVPTDANGKFVLPMVPEGSTTFTIVDPYGNPVRNFTTEPSGNATVQVPITPALLKGEVYYDINLNGVRDRGEPGYVNKVLDVVVVSNGALLASIPTDTLGAFSYPVYPQAGRQLVLTSKDGLVQKTFSTDSTGNGQVVVPLAPAFIQGVAFYDVDKNGVLGPKDIPFSTAYVDIRWPDTNVLLDRLSTNTTGHFSTYVIPNPFTTFTVVGPRGERWMNFTTDQDGNAVLLVPIPIAYVQGVIYRDTNLDSTFNSGEYVYTNFTVTFKFSNGTIYRTIATDSNGEFAFTPAIASPNAFLTIVEPKSGEVLGNVTLDQLGSGFANLPIPPAGITGRIYFDMDKSNSYTSADDVPYGPGQTLYLLNKDGSVFMSTTLNADGTFAFIPDIPISSATFNLVAAGNTSVILAANILTDRKGAAKRDVPIPPSEIVVTMWYDLVEDGVYGSGDTPVKNEVLQLLQATGLVFAAGTTLVNGTLIVHPKQPAPFEALDVYRATVTGVVQGSLVTDAEGNGKLDIKLSPGHLSGVVFWDVNRDSVQNAGDQPFAGNGSYVDIKFASGTLLSRVPLDANGGFAVKTVAYPGETFSIFLSNGVNAQSLTTDAVGDGSVSVPIPPPLIEGTVWYDYNEDRVYDMGGPDKPVANVQLLIRTATGAVYASATTDANGNFAYTAPLSLASMLPLQTLYVVDPSTSKVLGTVRTDKFGSGRGDVPLPQPASIVTGFLVFDMNQNTVLDPADVPYGVGKSVSLVFENGTVYLTSTIGPKGNFTFRAGAKAARNEALALVATADATVPLAIIKTDAYGNANQDVLLPPPTISGTIFYDLNRNLALEAGSDVPAVEVFLLKMANGTILANITVDSSGNFVFDPPVPTPLDSFTVVRPSQTNLEIAAIKTDAFGNGYVFVPLPPGVLSGFVWTDYTRNNQKDPSEPFYADMELHLVWPNGTDIPGSPVTTNSTGGFELTTAVYALKEIRLVQANGDFIRSFTTNAQGMAVMLAPIPPPTSTTTATKTKTSTSTSETTTETTTSTSETTTKTSSSTSETTSKTSSTTSQSTSTSITSTTETFTKTSSSTSETTTETSSTTSDTSTTTSQTSTSTSETTTKTSSSTSETSTTSITTTTLTFTKTSTTTSETTTQSTSTTSETTTKTSSSTSETTSKTSTSTRETTSKSATTTQSTTSTTSETQTSTTLTKTSTATPSPSVVGAVFWDMNSNGVQDSGDVPYSGGLMLNYASSGTNRAQTTLTSNGSFEFILNMLAASTQFNILSSGDNTSTLGSVTTDNRGAGSVVIPLAPPTIAGRLWLDVVSDRLYNASDFILANEVVDIVFPNGTVYGSATTLANGTFILSPTVPVANQAFSIQRRAYPGITLAAFNTSSKGSAYTNAPVPAPVTALMLAPDANSDAAIGTSEPPWKLKTVDIKTPNGTLFRTVTANSNGTISFVTSGEFPNQQFQIVDPSSGVVLGTYTTDGFGQANATIPAVVGPGQIEQTLSFAGNGSSAVCAASTYDVVLGSLVDPGSSNRTVQVDFTKGTDMIAGSLKYPSGWIVEYSSNGGSSWTYTEPSPASGITNIRATSGAPLTAGNWTNSTGNTAQLWFGNNNVSSTASASASLANGTALSQNWYETIFAGEIDKVFFVSRVVSYISLDCRIKSTGAPCPGYDWTIRFDNNAATNKSKFPAYSTHANAHGFYNPVDGFLYIAATVNLRANGTPYGDYDIATSDVVWGNPVVVCFNVSGTNPVFCPTRHYLLSNDFFWVSQNPTPVGGLGYSFFQLERGVWYKSQRLFYILERSAWKLYCWDAAAKTSCPNSPIRLSGTPPLNVSNSGTEPVFRGRTLKIDDTKLFVRTDLIMHCINVPQNTNCTGLWPSIPGSGQTAGLSSVWLSATWPPSVHESIRGVPDGVCLRFGCLDLQGNYKPTWGNPYNGIGPNAQNNWANSEANFVTYQGRIYMYNPWLFGTSTTGQNKVVCVDVAGPGIANCSGYTTYNTGDARQWGAALDPDNPICLYVTSSLLVNPNVYIVDAMSGNAGCPSLKMTELTLAPNGTSCSGRALYTDRYSFTVSSISGGNATAILLGVYDNATNTPIEGWTVIPVTVGQPISLTGLASALNGKKPKYVLTYGGATGTPVFATTFTYNGPGPEICWKEKTTTATTDVTAPFTAWINDNSTQGAVNFASNVRVVNC